MVEVDEEQEEDLDEEDEAMIDNEESFLDSHMEGKFSQDASMDMAAETNQTQGEDDDDDDCYEEDFEVSYKEDIWFQACPSELLMEILIIKLCNILKKKWYYMKFDVVVILLQDYESDFEDDDGDEDEDDDDDMDDDSVDSEAEDDSTNEDTEEDSDVGETDPNMAEVLRALQEENDLKKRLQHTVVLDEPKMDEEPEPLPTQHEEPIIGITVLTIFLFFPYAFFHIHLKDGFFFFFTLNPGDKF